MQARFWTTIVAFAALGWGLASPGAAADKAIATTLAAGLATRGPAFEPNLGQGPAEAAYVARDGRFDVSIASDGLSLRRRATGETAGVRFSGARADAPSRSEEPLRRRTAYFLGNDPAAWVGGAPTYGRVRFDDVYAGVDLVYYSRGGELEYDFVLRPGASADPIQLEFSAPVRRTADGALALGDGAIVQRRPEVYQLADDGSREAVEASYVLAADNRASFQIGDYDPERDLVIDPRVGLSSYLGGEGVETVNAVKLEADGGVWLAGSTDSTDFPIPADAFPSDRAGSTDIYIVHFERLTDAQGVRSWELDLTVFLGGVGRDRAAGFDIGSDGRLYVFGDTQSSNYPTTGDAEQRTFGGGTDAFLTILQESDFPFFQLTEEGAKQQFAPTNFELDYSTLHGGSGSEVAQGGFIGSFALDPTLPCPAIYGTTNSPNFPITVFAPQEQRGGGADSFFAFYCPTPAAPASLDLIVSSPFGGSREETHTAFAVTPAGDICAATRTSSEDLDATGLQQTARGNNDVYVACWTTIRRRLDLPFLYRKLGATYFGGQETESLAGMALDARAEGDFTPIVLLDSNSIDIPGDLSLPAPPAGGFRTNPGERSLLAVAFSSDLARRRMQFWTGSRGTDSAHALAWRDGCLLVAGRTAAADIALSETWPQPIPGGGGDILAGKFCLNSDLHATTEYLGYYGSPWPDIVTAVDMGPDGAELIAGRLSLDPIDSRLREEGAPVEQTEPGFPISAGAPQTTYGGGLSDAFVVELFRPRLRPEAVVNTASFAAGPIAPGEIFSIFGANFGPDTLLTSGLDAQNRLPRALGGTRVLFDGVAAPILFVSRNQVGGIAPFTLDGRGLTTVQIEVEGAKSRPITLGVQATRPAVFTLDQTGTGHGAILNQD